MRNMIRAGACLLLAAPSYAQDLGGLMMIALASSPQTAPAVGLVVALANAGDGAPKVRSKSPHSELEILLSAPEAPTIQSDQIKK